MDKNLKKSLDKSSETARTPLDWKYKNPILERARDQFDPGKSSGTGIKRRETELRVHIGRSL